MAQSKVNEFFFSKKKNTNEHAAKKRKIEIPFSNTESVRTLRSSSRSDDGKKSLATNPLIPSDSESDGVISPTSVIFLTKSSDRQAQETAWSTNSLSKSTKKQRGKRSFSSGERKSGSSKSEIGQRKLTDLLKISASIKTPRDGKIEHSLAEADGNSAQLTHDVNTPETMVAEEITSVWDDHKRVFDDVEIISRPQTRQRKIPVRKLISDKISENGSQSHVISHSAKKKLDLHPDTSNAGNDSDDETSNEVTELISGKSQLLALISEILVPIEHAVSPLPKTPERLANRTPSPQINEQALKNHLKQSGKIDAEIHRLCQVNKAHNESEKAISLEAVQGKTAEKVLSLPFTYNILEGAFQAMDKVVSMLHNRCEMCTFSKLRPAVQNITKKNFDEKTVGQIKTIVPDAYIFRQENNIPTFGPKSNEYQLTMEANLADKEMKFDQKQETKAVTSEGNPLFTASLLIKRQKCFRNNLIDYHKKCLASLNPPMMLADHQLTCWHSEFQLDKVPEVEASPLPQPPNVKVYHSAKDVLEKWKETLNPQEKDKKTTENKAGASPSSTTEPSLSSSFSSSESGCLTSLKGIPPALLAKIRAKEAQKNTEALTRSPSEDSKTKMMRHLPEIIRILRIYFVMEKKPALPQEQVYKQIEHSYRMGLSRREVEQHMKLLRELAPEFISVVEIRQGKYLQLDRGVDTQALSSRILNLVAKSRQ